MTTLHPRPTLQLLAALLAIAAALPTVSGAQEPSRAVPADAGLSHVPFEVLTRLATNGELGEIEAVVVERGGVVAYEELFRAGADRARLGDLRELGEVRLAQGDPMGHGRRANDVWELGELPLGDGSVQAYWLDDDRGGRVTVVPELDLVTVVTVAPEAVPDLDRIAHAVMADHVLMAVEMAEGAP